MYAKGTSTRDRACSLAWLLVFAAALVVGAGLPAGLARASVDLSSEVDVQIVVRPAAAFGAGEDFVLRDGNVLRSGDGVQLRLGSDADAYVYVIAYGSSNSALLLHPFSAKPKDAFIKQGQSQVIPGDGVFLPLDGREGRETLFSIVSDVPLMDIGELLPRIEAHGDDLTAITAMINAIYPRAQRLTFKHIGASPLVGVAASVPRALPAPDAATDKQVGAEASQTVGGGSLLPPAGSGWSVPSTQDFGSSEGAAATTETAAAAPASAGAAATTQASPTATASASPRDDAVQSAAAGAPTSVSAPGTETSALREAREAAGIDEHQFQGILATLPGSGQAALPEAVRKPHEEQGVLSAEGSRIRALGGSASNSSGVGWPADDDSPSKTQN